MEVGIEWEERTGTSKTKGKTRRSNGPQVAPPAVVAEQTGRVLLEREQEWLERLGTHPARFAALARGGPDPTPRHAHLYLPGRLAPARERPATARHGRPSIAAAH